MHTNYQTIKLGKGKHLTPDHGACVMELASMLAGEPFSDHPRSVSRPIAALLRGYNDSLDDVRRQDLYAYASTVVGTAASGEVEQARTAALVAWADDAWERHSSRSLLGRLRSRRARRQRGDSPESAARYALLALAELSDASHEQALELVDQLIAIGASGIRDAVEAIPGQAESAPSVRARAGVR